MYVMGVCIYICTRRERKGPAQDWEAEGVTETKGWMTGMRTSVG